MNLKSTLRSHYQSVKFPTIMLGIAYYLYTLFVPAAAMHEFVTNLLGNDVFTQWHEGILYGLVLLFVVHYFFRLIRYQQKGQFKPLYYSALLLLIMGVEFKRGALPVPVRLNFLPLNIFYFAAFVWGLLALGAMMNYFIKSETFQFRVWLSSFFKTTRKNEQTNISEETSFVFQSDIPLSFDNLNKDGLDKKLIDCGIREKVNGLAEQIKKFSPKDQSYIISITGKWGVGKTTFLNGLKRVLEITWEDQRKKHIVSYSPWSVSGSGVVLADFIEKIGNIIAKHNIKLRKLLLKYARVLSPVDRTGVITMVTSLFEQHKSIEEQLEEINECIKQTEKKLVIFVDDLDRLTPHEVLDVITFMRKTANLYNTFFVCAYDYDFVVESLIQQKIQEPDRYLEKIFQFVIPLHTNPVEDYIESLNQLRDDFKITKDCTLFTDKEYSNRWELPENIRTYLSSYRNVKRIYSEVRFAQLMVGKKTLPDKLFVLALLKIKSPYLYSRVWEVMENRPNEDKTVDEMINGVRDDQQKNESLIYEILTKNENINETELLWVKSLLIYLERTPPKNNDGQKPSIFHELSVKDFSISNLYTYYKYDRPDDYVDGIKLEWQKSDEIIKKLDRFRIQGKKTQFDKYLNNLLNYFREQRTVNSEDRESKFRLFNFLVTHKEGVAEEYVEMLRINQSEMDDDFIKKQMTSFDEYPANYNVDVLAWLKTYYTNINGYYAHPISLEQCKEMQISNLKYLIEKDANYDDIEVAFCICCDVKDRRFELYEKAKKMIQRYIEKNPVEFIKRMVKIELLYEKKVIALNPCYVAVFDWDKEKIREFISKHKKDTELIRKHLDSLLDDQGNLKQLDASEDDIKEINSKRSK